MQIKEPLRTKIRQMFRREDEFLTEEQAVAGHFERADRKILSFELWIKPEQGFLGRYQYIILRLEDFE